MLKFFVGACLIMCFYVFAVDLYGLFLVRSAAEKITKARGLRLGKEEGFQDVQLTDDMRLRIVQCLVSYDSFSIFGKKSISLGRLIFVDENDEKLLNIGLLKDKVVSIDRNQITLPEDILELCGLTNKVHNVENH